MSCQDVGEIIETVVNSAMVAGMMGGVFVVAIMMAFQVLVRKLKVKS